jgi:hypothetical protein
MQDISTHKISSTVYVVQKSQGKGFFENLCVEGKMVLNWMLEMLLVRIRIRFIWIMICASEDCIYLAHHKVQFQDSVHMKICGWELRKARSFVVS